MRLFASPDKQRKSAHKHSYPRSYSMSLRHPGIETPSAPPSRTCAPSPHSALHQHCRVASAPSCSCTPARGGPWPENVYSEASTRCDQPDSCATVCLATDHFQGREPLISDNGRTPWHSPRSTLLDQEAVVSGQVASNFGDVLTRIDREELSGPKADFPFSSQPLSQFSTNPAVPADTPKRKEKNCEPSSRQTKGLTAPSLARSYFSKVDLYANSKLPPDLPAMRLYIPTYQLLSLAAKYSANVYENSKGAERSYHIDADCRAGTKAMVIKSVPMDCSKTIVFAIRGTAHFTDWAVNLKVAPTSPVGFLDDLGNLCHAGFLSTARKMTKPVAERLRQLLEEDVGRASYSLLITGHSAGGAVAALLYLHILSVSDQAASELNLMAGCFRRIHCITFGTPPIALLPLQKPNRRGLESSLFLSFINEGDPVARADKAYVKSLVRLFTRPLQASGRPTSGTQRDRHLATHLHDTRKSFEWPGSHKCQCEGSRRHDGSRKTKASYAHDHNWANGANSFLKPTWDVPPATFSNAGRLVVLRSGDANAQITSSKTVEERLDEGVVAQFTTDEQLRGIVWGDPVSHAMQLYAGRIETLAIGAVMVGTCV